MRVKNGETVDIRRIVESAGLRRVILGTALKDVFSWLELGKWEVRGVN
jgi:hypothetical protein